MNYCTRCLAPSSQPDAHFSEDGVCGACLWLDEQKNIDWDSRVRELKDIAAWAKSMHAPYDCVIGVSGGKDSTFQALYARDTLGLRPLLVSGEPCQNTEIGLYNIENLKQLGFDTVSIRPNPQLMRKLFRHDFFNGLNPNKAAEYPLHASAYIIADKFDIPLVIQGDNPAHFSGVINRSGDGGDALQIKEHNTIREDPLARYKNAGIAAEELYFFNFDVEKIREKGIRGVWLTNYCKEWSAYHNVAFSVKHGLRAPFTDVDPYETGYYWRVYSLDHSFIEVNQYLKFIKFGYGSATELVAPDIRYGRISRAEGSLLIKEFDGRCGRKCILSFCELIGITEEEFHEHANKFYGPMWDQKADGTWELNDPVWKRYPPTEAVTVDEIIQRLAAM